MAYFQLIVSIVSSLLFGKLCSSIAKKNGKNSLLWFQLGFFFGIFALLFLFYLSHRDKLKASPEGVALETSNSTMETKALTCSLRPKTTLEEREWFYFDTKSQKEHKLSFKELKDLIQNKVVEESSFLWSEGMDQWMRLKDLAYLKIVLESEQMS